MEAWFDAMLEGDHYGAKLFKSRARMYKLVGIRCP